MRCLILLVASLVLAVPAAGRAQVALPTALVKVYQENPTLEAARARLRATDEDPPIARAGRRPQLAAGSSATLSQTDSSTGMRSLRTVRNAIGVEQPIYTGGAVAARIARAEESVQGERARLEVVEQAVFLAAIEAFTAVLRDQRVLELALVNESRLMAQLNAVQRRFRFGELTRTDVAQAEARYARGIADREAAAGALEIAGAAFRRVIGDPPGSLVEPTMPPGLPEALDGALAGIETHPAVRAARFGVAVAQAEIDGALAALKPRLSLRGDASYVDDPGDMLDWQSDLSVGAVLSIPLYQGGGEYARIRQTRQSLSEQRYNLQAARRDVEETIVAAWQALATARVRLEALARQVEAASLALDGVEEEARFGVRTVLDVLDAEQELFAAQVAVTVAEQEALIAAFGLKAGMGELTARALALDTAFYDPEAYYREVRGAWFGTGEASAKTDGPAEQD